MVLVRAAPAGSTRFRRWKVAPHLGRPDPGGTHDNDVTPLEKGHPPRRRKAAASADAAVRPPTRPEHVCRRGRRAAHRRQRSEAEGDNAHVVPTDTQKNTIFAFARDGITCPEALLERLADHFTSEFGWVTGDRWAAEEFGWSRVEGHDHAFFRNTPETRTAVLVRDGDTNTVISGFYGLTVMKTTQSGFVGYPKDKYTTLAETEDRILATDITTRWRYNTADVDHNAVYGSVRATMLEAFGKQYSKALQQTLYQWPRPSSTSTTASTR